MTSKEMWDVQEEVVRLKEAQQEAATAAEGMAAELEAAKDDVKRLRGQSHDLERTSSQQLQSQKLDMESLHRTEVCTQMHRKAHTYDLENADLVVLPMTVVNVKNRKWR